MDISINETIKITEAINIATNLFHSIFAPFNNYNTSNY